jgi:glycosyltransferase involved in cell wall biosynthesis
LKTAFFTQNIKRGGLDTFILNLITNWPEQDEVVLFCNSSHPGLAALGEGLAGRAKVVPYDFWIAQDISDRLAGIPALLQILFRALFWLLGFPYLVFKTGQLFKKFDADRLMVINGGYPGGDACLAATIAWRRSAPGRRAWHNFHNLALPYSGQPLRRLKELLIDQFVAQAAAGFVTVSRACMATLEARSPLAVAERAFIYNGIAPIDIMPSTVPASEPALPAEARLILMPAVYEARKGHAFMIRAMEEIVRRVPHATLLICGDGSPTEVDAVRCLREGSSVADSIVLQGHRRGLGNLMSQAHVLVLPSQGQESFGYTAVEAMACACPVVVTDVGGLPEVVDDGGSGYVVARDNVAALAERIVALLQDEGLRQQMGAAGVQRYRQRFTASRMAAEYFSLLEKV